MALLNLTKAVLLAGLLRSVDAGKQQPLAAHTQNPFNEGLADFVGDVMDRWKIAGMSVAVVDGDDVYSQVCTSSCNTIVPNAARDTGTPPCRTSRPRRTLSTLRAQHPRPLRLLPLPT